jgi:photosystem II stability/assembly factor-like uncharacterized protein
VAGLEPVGHRIEVGHRPGAGLRSGHLDQRAEQRGNGNDHKGSSCFHSFRCTPKQDESGPIRRVPVLGFTIAGPKQFLASGHPPPGQTGPRHLGLIESSDAGTTWKALSLAGEADFHVLRVRHNKVYGYNSARGQLLVSTDRINWQTRATIALRDFDVSPADPSALLATTEAGVERSTDGGFTWSPTGGPAALLLAWDAPNRLWGLSATGEVLRSTDGGSSWSPSGKLAGQASAFAAANGSLYAAVHERGIFRSADGGANWTQMYAQT